MVPRSLSSLEKAHPEYWRVKRLTKTTSFFRKLNHFMYYLFINISFLKMISWLILGPLFDKPHLLPHSVSWSNTLIKMKFSNLVLILLLQIWLSLFWLLFPFYNPWKHWKLFGFVVFRGDIKWGYWLEMGRYDISNFVINAMWKCKT